MKYLMTFNVLGFGSKLIWYWRWFFKPLSPEEKRRLDERYDAHEAFQQDRAKELGERMRKQKLEAE